MKVCILLCFLLFFPSQVNGQKIENLVFEGAGIRGLCYGGVIEVLEQEGVTKNLKRVGGTSAGAITAMLLAVGYNSQEITNIISDTRFKKFNDGGFIFMGGLARMKNRYGWYRGKKFLNWLDDLLEAKTGNGDITFSDLHESGKFLDLYCVATSLTEQKLKVLSYENYPAMKIKDAVRASMSIPLYYGAVFMDEKGGIHKKPDKNKNYEILVDGGITGNYPIFIFDEIKGEDRIRNENTLGVRIDSDLQTKSDLDDGELIPQPVNDLQDFISALYIYTIENLNRNYLSEEDWNRTISVSSKGIGPRIKKLSQKQKELLLNSGRHFTKTYLEAAR